MEPWVRKEPRSRRQEERRSGTRSGAAGLGHGKLARAHTKLVATSVG